MDSAAIVRLNLMPDEFHPGDDILIFGRKLRVHSYPERRSLNNTAVVVSDGNPLEATVQYFNPNEIYKVERLHPAYFFMTIRGAHNAEIAYLEAQMEWNRAAEHQRSIDP